jgi:hypothetical protein
MRTTNRLLSTGILRNEMYPVPILNYQAVTNYYVNGTTGNDSWNGTSETHTGGTTGPWKTIYRATQGGTEFGPGVVVNVAPGTYAENVILMNSNHTGGNSNSLTGFAVLRAAPNMSTPTARPYEYWLTNGASGSNPTVKIISPDNSGNYLGGIVGVSDGVHVTSYVIIDGFEITSTCTQSLPIESFSYNSTTGMATVTIPSGSVTGFSYDSTSGNVTLTLSSSLTLNSGTLVQISGLTGTGSISAANGIFFANATSGTTLVYPTYQTGLTMTWTGGGSYNLPFNPCMGVTISGLTGTGAISDANGYFFLENGTSSPTLVYKIGAGLTLSYSSGGTVSYASGADVGIGPGVGNVSGPLNPGAHHIVSINNLIHDLGGSGIAFEANDNVIIYGNHVYNTSWTNGYDESNLGLVSNSNATYTNGPLDDIYGTIDGAYIRNLICNNVSHHAGNLVPPQSDGNGIIIDTMHQSQTSCTISGYDYATLVYGNFCYSNAARGIEVFYSSRTAVINNTTFNNAQSIFYSTEQSLVCHCGSYNLFVNNADYTIVGTGTQSANISAGSFIQQNNNIGNKWYNNLLYLNGGTNTVEYNGFDVILGSPTGLKPPGISWNTRVNNSFAGGSNDWYVFYGIATNPLSDYVIDINLPYGNSTSIAAIAISGANISNPWDANGSLPAIDANSGSASPSVSVSTTATNTMILSVNNASTATTPSGFTSISSNNYFSIDYKIESTVQSGLSVSLPFTYASWLYADAIQQTTGGTLSIDSSTIITGSNLSSIPVTINTTNPNDVIVLIVSTLSGFTNITGQSIQLWSSTITYNEGDIVLGSDNNAYISLVGSNLNNNPITDSGANWQNDGPPNNIFPVDPEFLSITNLQNPNLITKSNSSAINKGIPSVNTLGGLKIFTPNIGAY